MAIENDGERAAVGNGMDYKTLFLGACSLVVILSGSVYGLWASRAEQAAEDSRTTNEHQWQSIQHLREQVLDNTGSIKQLRREADDREERLRRMDHLIGKLDHHLSEMQEKRR